MKNKFLFFAFILLISVSLSAQDRGRPITLAGFGTTVDVPGSYGDTWASAWSADDSVIFMNNDGTGITGAGSGTRYYPAHACINYVPPNFTPENHASLTNQRDGRRIIHPIDKNDFTAKYFSNFQGPQPWYPYSTDIYEVDGVLYCNFIYSFQIPGNWGFLYSNFMRSTDSGRTWQNHKGQTDTRTEANWTDAFFPEGWENPRFVKYGRGGIAPNVDGAREYVYFSSAYVQSKYKPPGGEEHGGNYIARIKRSDLLEWKTTPDGNGNNVRKKLEFLSYGWINTLADAQAVSDRHWTTDYSRARPIGNSPFFNIVYNEKLKRYFGTSNDGDCFQEPKVECSIFMLEAPYPWGPWTEIIDEHMTAKADDNLSWSFLSQKYISSDGYKMWVAVNGAHAELNHINKEGYILKFLPAYLTSEPVQTVMATDTARVSVNGLAQQTQREYRWGSVTGSSIGYGGFTQDGNNLTFNIYASSAGDYIVNFRYRTKGVPPWTNIAAFRRDPLPSISLYVNNNKAKQLRLGRSIQTYAEWTEMSIFLRLNAGSNTITFQRDRGDISDSVVISRLKYALYTGTSPLPLDNVVTAGSSAAPAATTQASTGTQAVISSWNTVNGSGSSISLRTANNENIGGQRFTAWTITGSLAPDSYAVAIGAPNSAALRAMRTMKSFSFTVLGDGKNYMVLLPTRETNQISDHYYAAFPTVAGEVTTVTIFINELAQTGYTGKPLAFNQNNIQQIQFQPVDQGAFNLKVWDIRTYQ